MKEIETIMNDMADLADGEFFVWGTGNTSELYYEGLQREAGIQIKAYIDSNSEKWGTDFHGTKIISPEEYRRNISIPVLINSAQKPVLDEISTCISDWGGGGVQ